MLIIKKGNILNATENIICHQVNENGIMGGGLALQIAAQYPNIEQEYKKYCNYFKNKNEELYGEWQLCSINKTQMMCNCFTQQNFNTRYDLLKKVFTAIKYYAIQYKQTICIPYKYGCGIANGKWEEVENIIIDVFNDYDIIIYKYDKENRNE